MREYITQEMIIARTIREVALFTSNIRKQGMTIGFVPTMGALHKGHIVLVEQSRRENDFTVCSIFVNPIQFNNSDDLSKYPRTEEADLELLLRTQCDLVFIPTVSEMYPVPVVEVFDFGNLDKVMEGAFRPGHFNGVAVVVKKLLEIVAPHRAYFGEKDFQQLTIIKTLVRMLKLPVRIVGCPTVRESTGLAMSSRNVRLDDKNRMNAAIINKTLLAATEKVSDLTPQELTEWVVTQLNKCEGMEVEYFCLVDSDTLQEVAEWVPGREVRGCVAVYLGGVRLIDNMLFFY